MRHFNCVAMPVPRLGPDSPAVKLQIVNIAAGQLVDGKDENPPPFFIGIRRYQWFAVIRSHMQKYPRIAAGRPIHGPDPKSPVGRPETKKPRLAGLSRHSQINLDFSGCNFGGEGGIRTHGTLRYA